MFNRTTDNAQPGGVRTESNVGPRPAGFSQQSQPQNHPTDFLHTQNSVIGPDLVISAQDLIVISQSSLRLDGETAGEVRATEIVVGEPGKVTGTVAAEVIVIHGEVHGTIRAPSVTLAATARVRGEIHHSSLEIARGAIFDGQSMYEPESANLMPKLSSA